MKRIIGSILCVVHVMIIVGYVYAAKPPATPATKVEQASSLVDAIRKSDIAKVTDLLEKGIDPNVTSADGSLPLIVAIEWAKDMIPLLLDHHADPNKPDANGRLPLVVATEKEKEKIVRLLLKAGAKPELSERAGSALTHAFLMNNSNLIKLLIPSAKTQESYNVSNQNCFVTFTSFEYRSYAFKMAVLHALSNNLIVMCPTYLLQPIFGAFQKDPSLLPSRWTLFGHKSTTLSASSKPQYDMCIIVPKPFEKKEKTEQLRKEYGFKNVDVITIDDVMNNSSDLTESAQLLESFKDMIDVQSKQHPTRFYLGGHGGKGIIAELSFNETDKFLSILADINAQFLYISTCNVAGQNLVEIQKITQKYLEGKDAQFP